MQYYESDNDDDEVEGEDFSFRKLTVLSRMLMTAVNAWNIILKHSKIINVYYHYAERTSRPVWP